MDDDLFKTKNSLFSAIEREGLTMFLGAYPSEGVIELLWNCALEPDPSAFVRAAKSSKAKVIYVNWIVFSDDDIEDAMIEFNDGGPGESDEDVDAREHNKTVEGFRKYVGNVASVRAGFFLDSVFHVFDQETTWYEEFGEVVGDGGSEEVPGGDRKSRLREEDLAWADKLAHHPAFAKTKDWGQRKYLLSKMAGQDSEALPVDAIIARAEAVYEVDLRPAEEARLAEQASQMRESGLSIVAIAGKLDLPRERVQRLLAKLEG